jgi:cysteine desulfurase/selenocysteine lyase
MDIKKINKDFPIFTNNPGLIYLDSAATSQKPQSVIDTVSEFYEKYNSNIHRGIYDLSQKATDIIEISRAKVAEFIGARQKEEIVFTGNASESINLVALGYFKKFLQKGDVIVTTEMEHHSNMLPWLMLKKSLGIKLFFLPITKNYELDYEKILSLGVPKNKIKLVALTHASNVLGTINPISRITKFLKGKDIKAKILVDGAQSAPHLPINVRKLGCDFFAFSSHKMLGPSGLGVLWARREILDKMEPLFVGGNMIETVTKKKATWAQSPDKFEPGTGRLESIAGLSAAIDYLNKLGMKNIENYEKELTKYALKKLTEIKDVKIFGKLSTKDRLGVFSFAINGVHPHDVGDILNRKKICIRTGHLCAQPLMKVLGVFGTSRASIYIYNTKADINMLVKGIMDVKKIFDQ